MLLQFARDHARSIRAVIYMLLGIFTIVVACDRSSDDAYALMTRVLMLLIGAVALLGGARQLIVEARHNRREESRSHARGSR